MIKIQYIFFCIFLVGLIVFYGTIGLWNPQWNQNQLN